MISDANVSSRPETPNTPKPGITKISSDSSAMPSTNKTSSRLPAVPPRNLLQKNNEKNTAATEFAAQDPDSRLEILLEPVPEGTKLTLIHQEIPEGQPDYALGWEDFYFKPMREYFSTQ